MFLGTNWGPSSTRIERPGTTRAALCRAFAMPEEGLEPRHADYDSTAALPALYAGSRERHSYRDGGDGAGRRVRLVPGFISLRRLVRRARDRIGQDRVEDVGVGRAVVHEVHRSRNPPTAPERLNVAPPHRVFPDVIRRITSATTGALERMG